MKLRLTLLLLLLAGTIFAQQVPFERILNANKVSLVAKQCKNVADLISIVSDADAIITQYGKIDQAVVGAMRNARVIVRYGVGVDNVDLESARARGIPV